MKCKFQNNQEKKKKVEAEMVYSAYTSALLFVTKGSQDRSANTARTWRTEPIQRPWRVLLAGLLPLACSACSLTEPRGHR